MISTLLHWIRTPARGKLAIASRPRGGDWLEGEIFAWKAMGVDTIVSLLEPEERRELYLEEKSRIASIDYRMDFLSLPIPDRGLPPTLAQALDLLERMKAQLEAGRSIVIHCRQGVGRAGMIAARLLASMNVEPQVAIAAVSAALGVPVPETVAQREWITSSLAASAPIERP